MSTVQRNHHPPFLCDSKSLFWTLTTKIPFFFYFSGSGGSGSSGSGGGDNDENKGKSHYSCECMLSKLHIGVILHRHSIYIQTKFLLF